MRILCPALFALSALCACSGGSSRSASASTPTASATVTRAPLATPSLPAPPTLAPSGRVTLSNSSRAAAAVPNSVASPVFVAPKASPDARPHIYKVNLDKTTVNAGDTLSGSVLTSSNVASVEARVATYGIVVPKTGVGVFSLTYKVPDLPFFLHRTYDMTIIARNARGDATSADLPITIH